MSSLSPVKRSDLPRAPAPPAPASPTGPGRWLRRVVATLLIVTGLLTLAYCGISAYVATKLVYTAPTPNVKTPASLGLDYRDVTFPSRDDHLTLKGWYIPGVLPDGNLTTDRAIIMVHGIWTNRSDLDAGQLDLGGQFAKHGFAVLMFDMRGHGASTPAPISFGLYEQRDVLGAFDFLRSGALPYPALGRPRIIGGFGESMGGSTLLMAAAKEPGIKAIIADAAYAAISPRVERDLPPKSGLPAFFTPGSVIAVNALYGYDLYSVRPIDSVASITPRPIFFIHGLADTQTYPENSIEMASTALKAGNQHVQVWLVPGATHAQSFHVAGEEYVNRVVAFFTTWLGANS